MTVPFTLVQLRYFEAVARLEHMTAAAAELNVTQSTLSSAIGQLERDFGLPLFTRLPRRGLRITAAGRALRARTAAFLEEAELLSRAVQESADGLRGDLVVGIYAPLAPFRAPTLLKHFEAQYPEVTLTFLEGDQGTLQEALITGRCEIALMYDLGVGEQFGREVIQRVPPHVIVPELHPFASAGEVSLRDFEHEPFILLDLPHTRDYYLGLFRQLSLSPHIRHVSWGYETVRSFVGLGHGYSVLNQWVEQGPTYAAGSVVPLRLTDDLPPTEVSLVHLAGVSQTKKARAFARVCRALFNEAAPLSL